jgi:MFS family permease
MPRVLRHRPFRFLWLSQLFSLVGDRLVMVVLALAVTDLTGDPKDVGLVFAARFAPLVLLTLFGGVLADRLPRRAIMVAADAARLLLHAALAALFLAGVVEVWHIILIEALFAVAEAFAVPAYQGLIPQTVPEEEIQDATALSTLSRNAATLLGPALGTAIFVAWGAGTAFAVDAATFGVSAALLLGVHARRRGEPVARTGVLREVADGFREVRSRVWLWWTLLTVNLWLFVAEAPLLVLGPTRGEEAYGDAAVFGIFMTASGAGMVLGSLLAMRWRPQRPMVVAFLAGSMIPFALAVLALGLPLGVVYVVAVGGGVGSALFDVFWFTSLATHVPPEALSRVSSFDYMLSFASLPLGYVLAGPAADALGTETVLVGGAVIALVLSLSGLLPRATRQLRGAPAPGVPAAPAPALPSDQARAT